MRCNIFESNAGKCKAIKQARWEEFAKLKETKSVVYTRETDLTNMMREIIIVYFDGRRNGIQSTVERSRIISGAKVVGQHTES